MNLKKLDNENEEQFIWRLCRAKDSGELDIDWDGLAKIFNEELREDETEYYNESAYRKPYQQALRFYEAGVFKDLTSEAYLRLVRFEKQELQKEKQKVHDEKLELNKWLRENARDERIAELICDEIRNLPELPIPQPVINIATNRAGALCIADQHYGTEFCIKGLNGEVINEYNPDIFEKRMEALLGDTIQKVQKEGLTSLKIYSLGDELDGILRVSQLTKLKYGVVESTIRYAKYMASWLTKLTEYVNVEFHMTFGNHTELRMISQPKGTFVEENMGKVVKEFLAVSMENNPNFTIKTNESGLIVDNLLGYNILGIHGEVKNMSQALETFSNIYNTKIDILIAGHKHHFKSETVGINREVVNIPSIIGADDYSMTIGKISNAGATFIIVEEGKGLTDITTFKFN